MHLRRFGVGALAEGGHLLISHAAVQAAGATQQEVEAIVARETREMQRRVQAYRGGQPHLPVKGARRRAVLRGVQRAANATNVLAPGTGAATPSPCCLPWHADLARRQDCGGGR